MSKSTFSVYQSLLTWNEWKDLERTDICIRVDGDRGWEGRIGRKGWKNELLDTK